MAGVAGHTLPKRERLSGKTTIAGLLRHGRYGHSGCLKYCIAPDNGLEYDRILISVPKKQFRRAVKRNLLKRRIRESYRLRKDRFPSGCDILFIYTAGEVLPFVEIAASMDGVAASVSGSAV